MTVRPFVYAAALLTATAPAQGPEASVDGSWTLLKVVDARGAVTPAAPAPTLTVSGTAVPAAEGARVSGSGGCNTFSGSGVFTATTVRLGPLAATRKACAPAVMALETRVLTILNAARGVSLSASTLVLSTGTARLVYGRRATAMDMTRLHARWRLVGEVTDPAPTVEFGPDGRVTGDTGCNRLSGTYTVDGPALTLSPLATTRRACASGALQAQEAAFLALLARVRSYAVSGAQLVLTLDDGSTHTLARPVN